MNINEHDKKEIKGCMKLLETIKDTSRDYVGTNGCLYQDITREELDLIVNEIERLKISEEKYKDSQLYIKDFKDEIERLNNIIETLEEELQSEIDIPFKNLNLEYNTYIDIRETLKKVLRRIKELKENK